MQNLQQRLQRRALRRRQIRLKPREQQQALLVAEDRVQVEALLRELGVADMARRRAMVRARRLARGSRLRAVDKAVKDRRRVAAEEEALEQVAGVARALREVAGRMRQTTATERRQTPWAPKSALRRRQCRCRGVELRLCAREGANCTTPLPDIS